MKKDNQDSKNKRIENKLHGKKKIGWQDLFNFFCNRFLI